MSFFDHNFILCKSNSCDNFEFKILLVAKKVGIEDVTVEKVNLPYLGYKTIEDLLWRINMALWQLEFIIVPKDKLSYKNNTEEIDILNLWNGYKIKENSIDEIEKALKRSKSWSEDIVQLGDISETVIELLYDNGMIDEINCRLDLRNINIRIVDTILSFISINNLAIIVDKKIYVDPNRELILEIIKESDAYRFIKNPEKFLEEI